MEGEDGGQGGARGCGAARMVVQDGAEADERAGTADGQWESPVGSGGDGVVPEAVTEVALVLLVLVGPWRHPAEVMADVRAFDHNSVFYLCAGDGMTAGQQIDFVKLEEYDPVGHKPHVHHWKDQSHL